MTTTPTTDDIDQADHRRRRALRVLQDVGVEEEQMDPVSLVALQELLQKRDNSSATGTPPLNDKETETFMTLRSIVPPPRAGAFNTLTANRANEVTRPSPDAVLAPDTTGGGDDDGQSQIVRQLQRQSQQLHELQQQMHEMRRLLLLQQQQQQYSHSSTAMLSSTTTTRNTLASHWGGGEQPSDWSHELPPPLAPNANNEAPPLGAPQPQQRQHRGFGAFIAHVRNEMNVWDNVLRNVRIVRLGNLLLVRFATEVPGLDMGLLVKVAFLLAVLGSRVSRRDQAKMRVTILVVALGLLYQTGYLSFLYRFVVQHNYVARILWHNEYIDAHNPQPAAAATRQPHPPAPHRAAEIDADAAAAAANDENGDANNNEQPAAAFDWRNTFLAGRIARPNEQPLLVRLVADLLMLLASFFLSILPMWRPEGPPPPPHDEQPDGEGAAADDDAPDGPAAAATPRGGTIPPVAPPANALEPASDDEED